MHRELRQSQLLEYYQSGLYSGILDLYDCGAQGSVNGIRLYNESSSHFFGLFPVTDGTGDSIHLSLSVLSHPNLVGLQKDSCSAMRKGCESYLNELDEQAMEPDGDHDEDEDEDLEEEEVDWEEKAKYQNVDGALLKYLFCVVHLINVVVQDFRGKNTKTTTEHPCSTWLKQAGKRIRNKMHIRSWIRNCLLSTAGKSSPAPKWWFYRMLTAISSVRWWSESFNSLRLVFIYDRIAESEHDVLSIQLRNQDFDLEEFRIYDKFLQQSYHAILQLEKKEVKFGESMSVVYSFGRLLDNLPDSEHKKRAVAKFQKHFFTFNRDFTVNCDFKDLSDYQRTFIFAAGLKGSKNKFKTRDIKQFMSEYVTHYHSNMFVLPEIEELDLDSDSEKTDSSKKLQFELPIFEPTLKRTKIDKKFVTDIVNFIDREIVSEPLAKLSRAFDNVSATSASLESDFKDVTAILKTKNPLIDLKLIEDCLLIREEKDFAKNMVLCLIARDRALEEN